MENRTPLYDAHVALGAKMTAFAGYSMPVRYTGDIKEHLAVRQKAGLFDVSHMGEIEINGPKALSVVQKLITNDASKLPAGKALYSPMCYRDGGVVDDIIVFCVDAQHYFICVNASNVSKDFAWMKEQAAGEAKVVNVSEDYGLIAVQGPLARSIVEHALREPALAGVKRFHFHDMKWGGVHLRISRTGYTGEDGFEVYCPAEKTERLWNVILNAGSPQGLIPCGLGARDSLRLEAALPLYGHELDRGINPIEAGLGWTVKEKTGGFNGSEKLLAQKAKGAPRTLVGILSNERAATPRRDYAVSKDGQQIGTITSGLFSPSLEKGIGLALVTAGKVKTGDFVDLAVRGKTFPVSIVDLPFVRKSV